MDIKQFILEQLNSNQFFQGAGLTAILVGIWSTVKSFGPRVWRAILKLISYEVVIDTASGNCDMYHAVREWATSNKKVRRARWYINHDNALVKEETEDWGLLWIKGRPLKISKEREKLEQAQYLDSRYEDIYRLIYWFGKKPLDDILQKAYETYIAKQRAEEGIPLWNASPDSYEIFRKRLIKDVKPFSALFFTGKEELIADIDSYLGKKELYRRHGIRCKRGYLLYGPPGTGKTSTVLAVAEKTGRPIYMIPLSDIKTDTDLIKLIAEIPTGSILAFEDIDALFVKREGATLSYSAFLNCIDGVHSPDDCLIFMTTNHKDTLDTALLRKGRLDFKLEIGFPQEREIKAFLHNFYGEEPTISIESMPMTDVQDMVLKSETLADWESAYQNKSLKQ